MPTPNAITGEHYSEPMLVRQASASVVSRLMAKASNRRFSASGMDDCDDMEDEGEMDSPSFEMDDGEIDIDTGQKINRLAIVKVCGVLMRDVAGCSAWGLVDYEELTDQIEDAEGDNNIDGIVLVIDSPGGGVTGCIEAAQVVERCTKPVLVFSSGLLCSAAYWLASGASMIATTRSASSGSIGVYVPLTDLSGMFGQMGVAVDVIASGEQKGAGYPGTSLTPAQRDLIQRQVNETANDFQTAVLDSRPNLDLSLFDGRDVRGDEAKELGLVDVVVHDFDEAVEMFRKTFL